MIKDYYLNIIFSKKLFVLKHNIKKFTGLKFLYINYIKNNNNKISKADKNSTPIYNNKIDETKISKADNNLAPHHNNKNDDAKLSNANDVSATYYKIKNDNNKIL